MNKLVLCIYSIFLLINTSCTRPLAVTHWDAKERALVKRSMTPGKDAYGYPEHTKLSAVVCFNKYCLSRQESINFREKYRFKGYKNNKPPQSKPAPEAKESVIAAAPEKETNATKPAPAFNQSQIFKQVYFATGKAELKPESTTELNEILSILQQNPELSIIVSGHTDNVGDEKANVQLSRERAEAVIKYLATQGIAKDRLAAKGYGSSKPLTSNDTQEGRNQNRRVEFLITGNKN